MKRRVPYSWLAMRFGQFEAFRLVCLRFYHVAIERTTKMAKKKAGRKKAQKKAGRKKAQKRTSGAQQAAENVWNAFLRAARPRTVATGLRSHAKSRFFKRIQRLLKTRGSADEKRGWRYCATMVGKHAKAITNKDKAITRTTFNEACKFVRDNQQNQGARAGDLCA
jgi:hypothetical protein